MNSKSNSSNDQVIDLTQSDLTIDSSTISNYKRRKYNDNVKWQPFYLLSYKGINKSSTRNTLRLNDIINSTEDSINHIVLLNYKIDINWIVNECPNILDQQISLLVIHGDELDNQSKQLVKSLNQIKSAKVDMGIERYGTHHSKIAIIYYSSGVRIAIFTANFIETDFEYLTNGVYVQDFPLNCNNISSSSLSAFQNDLLNYLKTVNLNSQKSLYDESINRLLLYDFTSAEVCLIASKPGRHSGITLNNWGHNRLSSVLESYHYNKRQITDNYNYNNDKLILQFSSIGSLGKNEKYLDEVVNSMTKKSQSITNSTKVQLVWPSVETVRNSIIGYSSGSSLPSNYKTLYQENNELRPGLKSKLHLWDGTQSSRQNIIAHMKCYFTYNNSRTNNTEIELDWFLLTSANLSQAAWGVLEKNNQQLYIKSYEIGVLFLRDKIKTNRRLFSLTPNHNILGVDNNDSLTTLQFETLSTFSLSEIGSNNNNNVVFPIPFQVPPQPYTINDKPWVWDISYPLCDILGQYKR